ncbi:FAD-binding oxidoreductase [uncultured Piscinibacter sp.]|uniref:NAD(P)/FAD-dependent oxidoreductase n=1 Tax=uncultured Piscinibacter sp. TaxID=1131835 RepID=UPI002639FF6A|nr:FAD-binding oxidoreductase [uncultured Piscinibacter sp.]
MAHDTEVIIVGAGIAGASIAFFLSATHRVVLLEAEAQPGYHSTGRSAAMFMESYGTPTIRALTRASRAFYAAPPPGFGDTPLIAPRGAMYVGTPEQRGLLDLTEAELRPHAPDLRRLAPAEAIARVPVLRPQRVDGALLDPAAADIDVHALHQGFLRRAKANGATLVTDARVVALDRRDGAWTVCSATDRWRAPIVVDAAGAWADQLARLAGLPAIGLQPRRRAAFLFAPPADVAVSGWPCVCGVDEGWYFKPDAGVLLGSPANADPVEPHDVRPEELDIATGIAAIEAMTTLNIRRPSHTWAGLRSFVPDGDLVAGFDPLAPGFFWAAAQGGYGIQTAPAMGELCAAWLRGEDLPERIALAGVEAAPLHVARLRRQSHP